MTSPRSLSLSENTRLPDTTVKTYLFSKSTPLPNKPRSLVREFRAVSAESMEAARKLADADSSWDCLSSSPTVASYTHYITYED